MEALGPVTDRSGTVSDVNQGPIGPGHNLAINCFRPRPGPQIAVTDRSGTASDHDQGCNAPDRSSVRDCLRPWSGLQRARSQLVRDYLRPRTRTGSQIGPCLSHNPMRAAANPVTPWLWTVLDLGQGRNDPGQSSEEKR